MRTRLLDELAGSTDLPTHLAEAVAMARSIFNEAIDLTARLRYVLETPGAACLGREWSPDGLIGKLECLVDSDPVSWPGWEDFSKILELVSERRLHTSVKKRGHTRPPRFLHRSAEL